jgi:hypothetical protein
LSCHPPPAHRAATLPLPRHCVSRTQTTTRKELADVKKELADVQNELADAKKEAGSASRNTSGSSSRHNEIRDDLKERLGEKEQIKPDAFKQKSAILRKHKEKEERWKMDAKRDKVCTIKTLERSTCVEAVISRGSG